MSARVEVFRARSLRSRWRFRIVAANGQVVGQSSESYTRQYDAERGFWDLYEAINSHPLPVERAPR